MNNQSARSFSEDTFDETYISDARQSEPQQTSDASGSQKAYTAEAEAEDLKARTADRWWLRKRVMGF